MCAFITGQAEIETGIDLRAIRPGHGWHVFHTATHAAGCFCNRFHISSRVQVVMHGNMEIDIGLQLGNAIKSFISPCKAVTVHIIFDALWIGSEIGVLGVTQVGIVTRVGVFWFTISSSRVARPIVVTTLTVTAPATHERLVFTRREICKALSEHRVASSRSFCRLVKQFNCLSSSIRSCSHWISWVICATEVASLGVQVFKTLVVHFHEWSVEVSVNVNELCVDGNVGPRVFTHLLDEKFVIIFPCEKLELLLQTVKTVGWQMVFNDCNDVIVVAAGHAVPSQVSGASIFSKALLDKPVHGVIKTWHFHKAFSIAMQDAHFSGRGMPTVIANSFFHGRSKNPSVATSNVCQVQIFDSIFQAGVGNPLILTLSPNPLTGFLPRKLSRGSRQRSNCIYPRAAL
mmetsp:Transcript_11491/g.25637  ORF Transcript_11491/g.25637 Transcript_11491/m.25637 type:complete len:402 (-) Transcript_11491:396-1601(-)